MTGVSVDLRAARVRAARLSVWVGVLMLGLKMAAFVLTNSTAILSDALESVVHVGAVLVMYGSLRLAARPPDANHPYGHGKAEFFSIAFEGGMIVLAALAVFWETARELWRGHQVADIDQGLWLSGLAAAINLALGWHLVRTGRRTRSDILIADGRHVLSDVWTSAGALIGIGLVRLTGNPQIDIVTAFLLGAFILYTGISLVRQAIAGLMDEADPKTLSAVIATINELREPEWLDVHNLRLRVSGDVTFIDFHLMVPGDWSVREAHDDIERLEQHLLEKLGRGGAVMIHLDYPKHGEHVETPPQPFTVATATRMKDGPQPVHA